MISPNVFLQPNIYSHSLLKTLRLKPDCCYGNYGVKITGLLFTQTQVRLCAVSNRAVVYVICSCLVIVWPAL